MRRVLLSLALIGCAKPATVPTVTTTQAPLTAVTRPLEVQGDTDLRAQVLALTEAVKSLQAGIRADKTKVTNYNKCVNYCASIPYPRAPEGADEIDWKLTPTGQCFKKCESIRPIDVAAYGEC